LNQIEDIMDNGFLPKGDPKIHIADTIIDAPVDVNEAEFEELINVPGIGHKTAIRIMILRELKSITKNKQLDYAGVILNKARPYLKIDGKSQKKISEYK